MTFLLLLVAFLVTPLTLHASDSPSVSLSQFSSLPIAYEGRPIAMSEFARRWLLSIDDQASASSATTHLANTLFAPQKMDNVALFQVSTALRETLKLPARAGAHYSANQLDKAYRPLKAELLQLSRAWKREQPLQMQEEALLSLYLKLRQFRQLQQSFSLFNAFNSAGSSYFSLLPQRVAIKQQAMSLASQKGDDLSLYSETQQALMLQSMQLDQLETIGFGNQAFKVIPTTQQQWFSPWELLENSQLSPQTMPLLQQWQQLGEAYRAGDQTAFSKTANELKQRTLSLSDSSLLPLILKVEPVFNLLHLFFVLGCVMLVFAIITLWKSRWGAMLLAGSTAALGASLLVRTLLLGRAPVSNLYESVLFVSLLVAALIFLLYRRHSLSRIIIPATLASCGTLLLVAESLMAPSQDRLPVLAAVLNSNFWLGTHVICITAGYALTLIVGLIAHIHLWQQKVVHRTLTPLTVVALLLTAIGTWLGGIWADQSWGRFWGWDPKENGALLIVLWLSWLLHYRYHRWYRPRIYLAVTASLIPVVMIAWFGVNLLGVGLHSYGFSNAAAYGLIAFLLLELVVISAFCFRRKPHVG